MVRERDIIQDVFAPHLNTALSFPTSHGDVKCPLSLQSKPVVAPTMRSLLLVMPNMGLLIRGGRPHVLPCIPTAAFSDIVYWSPGLYLLPPIFLMDVEKRKEGKKNPEAQKYILEAHRKFICKILDRAEHEIRWNEGSLRLF